MQNRNYCFTVNNPEESDAEQISQLDYQYLIIGKEKGESGTPHLQCYVQFKNPVRFSTLKNKIPRAHIEIAKGTPEQNITYCSKEGSFVEFGTPKTQGSRSDLNELALNITSGYAISDIAEMHPTMIIKYSRGIEKLYSIIDKPMRRDNINVLWLWGSTGAGKSRYAFENYDNVYVKDHTQWWDGYTNEVEVILIDDFDRRWPFRDLLRLLDRYPYKGQTKGGYMNINCEQIIITCDRSPKKLFEDVPIHEYSQLERRITEVRELKPTHKTATEVAGNTIPPLIVASTSSQ